MILSTRLERLQAASILQFQLRTRETARSPNRCNRYMYGISACVMTRAGLVPLIRLAFATSGPHLVYLRGMQWSICCHCSLPFRIFHRVGHTPVLSFTNLQLIFLVYLRIQNSCSHRKRYNAIQKHVCLNHIFIEHIHHMNFANDNSKQTNFPTADWEIDIYSETLASASQT